MWITTMDLRAREGGESSAASSHSNLAESATHQPRRREFPRGFASFATVLTNPCPGIFPGQRDFFLAGFLSV